jgi:hypothetical protein
LIGLGANDLDRLAIAICRQFLLAANLVHHAEAVPAVVDFGKACEEIAGGILGFRQPAGTNEVGHGIRAVVSSSSSPTAASGAWNAAFAHAVLSDGLRRALHARPGP